MNKKELENCEKLLNLAIREAESADKLYKEDDKENIDCTLATIPLRKADQAIGYARGINQALASIGYKSEKMAKLGKLL